MKSTILAIYLQRRLTLALGLVAIVTVASAIFMLSANLSYREATSAQESVDHLLLKMAEAENWANSLQYMDIEERRRVRYIGDRINREARGDLKKLCTTYRSLTPGIARLFEPDIGAERTLLRFFKKLRAVRKSIDGQNVAQHVLDLSIFSQTNAFHVMKALAKETHEYQHRQAERYYVVSALFSVFVMISLVVSAFGIFRPMRTAILSANKDLASALSDAQAAARTKDRFLKMICHQLRTPMNGIIGATQLLRTSAVDPKQSELVDLLDRSGLRAHRIFEQVLGYAALTEAAAELDRDVFNPRELAQDVVLWATPSARDGVSIDMVWRGGVDAPVSGDQTRLATVLTNLLDNAVRHTQKGNIRVVGQLTGEPDTPELIYVVADNGPGIPSQQRARIFQSFEKRDDQDSGDDAGIGLGLAISHRIVTLMEGEIGVVNGAAGGAAFWLRVPVSAAPGHWQAMREDDQDKSSDTREGDIAKAIEAACRAA